MERQKSNHIKVIKEGNFDFNHMYITFSLRSILHSGIQIASEEQLPKSGGGGGFREDIAFACKACEMGLFCHLTYH